MKVSHSKDFNHSYLQIQSQEEIRIDSYSIQMLLNGNMTRLLPCKLQMLNGIREFCYDYTGKCSLADLTKTSRIGEKHLKNLFIGILKAFDQVQAHLLEVDNLLLDPAYIFCDAHGETMRFCYFPGYEHPYQGQLNNLLEYLLAHLDHGEDGAMALGYRLYRVSVEEGLDQEKIQKALYGPENGGETSEDREEKSSIFYERKETEMNRQNTDMERNYEPAKEMTAKKRFPLAGAIMILLWIGLLLAMCFLRYQGYMNFITFPVLLGIFLAVLGIIGLNIRIFGRVEPVNVEGEDFMPMPDLVEPHDLDQWPGQRVVAGEEIEKYYREKPAPYPPENPPGNATTMWSPQEVEAALKPMENTQKLPNLKEECRQKLISLAPDLADHIYLRGDLTLIGKLKNTVDVVIDQPTISRMHAKLRRVDQEYYLTDLNSTNGTFVNGQRLESGQNQRINPGDQIRFAEIAYEFQI